MAARLERLIGQGTCTLRLLLLCQFVCDGLKFCQSTSLLHQRLKKENHA